MENMEGGRVMPEIPMDVTALLGPERAAFVDLLNALSPAQWDLPTECPAWTVKGVALHVLGDDLSLLSRQRDASTDSLTIFAEDHPGATFRELLDGFNEQWVAAARFLSGDVVIEMLRSVGEWTEDFYVDVDLDTLAREPVGFFAADGPSPYWQVVGREYVERIVHHSQIRRALGASGLDTALLVGGGAVQVHAIGAWMRDHAPADGTSVGFVVGSVGSWHWVRNAEGWSVAVGDHDAPDATIAVDPDVAAAALTRGIDAPGLRAGLSVSGDATLTSPFVDLMLGFLAPPAT